MDEKTEEVKSPRILILNDTDPLLSPPSLAILLSDLVAFNNCQTIKSSKSAYPPGSFSSAVQLLAQHPHVGYPQPNSQSQACALELNHTFSVPLRRSSLQKLHPCVKRTSILLGRELLQWLAQLLFCFFWSILFICFSSGLIATAKSRS